MLDEQMTSKENCCNIFLTPFYGATEMAIDQLDARQQLAKMEAELKAAQEKAQKAEEEFEAKSKELKAKLRADDLADVIAKCKLHEFTATDLRGALKTKGARKSTPRKSTARKSTGRGRAKKAAA